MTDDEIRDWLNCLDKNPAKQIEIVKDLLWWATEAKSKDEMSDEDRTVCTRGLEILNEMSNPQHEALQPLQSHETY